MLPEPANAVRVVYADAALLVVDKPAGLLAVPGRGADKADCAAARIGAEYPDALIVHRLDMATSGLLIFARGAAMQAELNRMFRERRVDKRYVAVVAGHLALPAGEIDLPLAADWPNRPRQRIDHEHGRPSRTLFRVLGRSLDGARTRVELTPLTGRTHQLRVHLAAIGHPIIGDALYAAPESSLGERLLLHASELALPHPLSGAMLRLSSAVPF